MPRHAEISRVPHDSCETLRDPVASDDYDYLPGQLLNRLARGPDAFPDELWKGAPDSLKCILLDCANAILRGDSPLIPSWLGGLVRFLFKKGDALSQSCYFPVCLLDTAYKILSAILTDRLYLLAERLSLLDASQEGFPKLQLLHSTQRQVQSLHWAFETAAKQLEQIYCVYLDFANAFNSIDHEALWRWLCELNIPDIDLLQTLYENVHY